MTTVLVLTNSLDDLHVEAVREHVENLNHRLIRVDIDRIVRGENQILWDYQQNSVQVIVGDKAISLNEVGSVWWRKPFGFGGIHGFAESIRDPVQRNVAEKEVRDLVEGLCATLESKFWLNRPSTMATAKLKPLQLHVARNIGILMPDTIITSDPGSARAFCSKGPTIFKPLVEPILDYGEVSYGVETTLINEEHMRRFDLIKSQPIMLQRFIAKKHELRVTCVGDQLFVAKQELSTDISSDVADWRPLQGTAKSTYSIGSLPEDLVSKVSTLLQRLNLGFAAIDFAVSEEGQCYFLEVNPNGQWLGYTDLIGLPAASAIARCLVEKTMHSTTHLERR